jgi:hypothetical protein
MAALAQVAFKTYLSKPFNLPQELKPRRLRHTVIIASHANSQLVSPAETIQLLPLAWALAKPIGFVFNSLAIFLLSPNVALRERSGMKLNDLRRAQRVVADHRDELLAMWETLHGEDR